MNLEILNARRFFRDSRPDYLRGADCIRSYLLSVNPKSYNISVIKVRKSENKGGNRREVSGKFHNFADRMEDEKQSKTKYYLYIDECGDQNLEHYDPSFPIFTLCGILVPEKNLNALNNAFNIL